MIFLQMLYLNSGFLTEILFCHTKLLGCVFDRNQLFTDKFSCCFNRTVGFTLSHTLGKTFFYTLHPDCFAVVAHFSHILSHVFRHLKVAVFLKFLFPLFHRHFIVQQETEEGVSEEPKTLFSRIS